MPRNAKNRAEYDFMSRWCGYGFSYATSCVRFGSEREKKAGAVCRLRHVLLKHALLTEEFYSERVAILARKAGVSLGRLLKERIGDDKANAIRDAFRAASDCRDHA